MQSNAQRWKEIYDNGHEQHAPWDEVVSFVYRHKPEKENHEIKILEVGCGTGSNLAFLDSLGFVVAGIDQDETAIIKAGQRSGPQAEYEVGDFRNLPWDDGVFDMVIDRAALTYVDGVELIKAVDEVRRVLSDSGKFLFTPYAIPGDWRQPFNLADLFALLNPDKWDIIDISRVDVVSLSGETAGKEMTSHYRVVAQKRKTA